MNITNTFLVNLLANADEHIKNERIPYEINNTFGQIKRSDCSLTLNGKLILGH